MRKLYAQPVYTKFDGKVAHEYETGLYAISFYAAVAKIHRQTL